MQGFYLFLCIVDTVVLAFYNNGFEEYTGARSLQYCLFAIALILSITELVTFIRNMSSHKHMTQASSL